jgi:hypothetical protein
VVARSSAVVVGGLLLLASRAAAAQPEQQVVLPGPVPYPTLSPPLVGFGPAPPGFTRYVFHITSAQLVRVGVDGAGRATSVKVRQRLGVSGRGDYQFGISAPIEDVRRAPGSDSDPGLRVNQILYAGFSPGRKVLAADVTLRPRPAARYLPLRLRLRREDGGVSLSILNATATPVLEYAGTVRPRQIAALLDETRRAARAHRRVSPAHATFFGAVRERKPRPSIEAPIHVEGELRLPGSAPVRFARTLGDGGPLEVRVRAQGGGRPRVRLRAWPIAAERVLRPPGASTWVAAIARRAQSPALLLQRLLGARMRMVRADQYEAFLSNPDADGRNHAVYVYATAATPQRRAAPAPAGDSGGGTSMLVVLLAVCGSVLGVGVALVAWAHS